jgi:hypothetical protein
MGRTREMVFKPIHEQSDTNIAISMLSRNCPLLEWMTMKDGIIELRQKGASLRLIRELLATVGVAVGADTIARFLAEVNGESQPLGNYFPTPRTSQPPLAIMYS